ncbi:MAG: hypothetical protein J1E64_15410 [Acetatifactor sp.]|nr:hypothetical protein [Acetatifactor sp.]
MTITEEQAKNGYPLEAVRFLDTFDSYLSNSVDEYGIKKCEPDSFKVFEEAGPDIPQNLMSQYEESVKAIHEYMDKGYKL